MKDSKREKILIVDRDPIDVKLYKLIFRDLFSLMIAEDVEVAYKLIKEHDIKVIIADDIQIASSVISFFESLEQKQPNIKRILVTGNDEPQFIQDAINKGRIFSYLTKPCEPHKLIIAVERAIEQFNLQENNNTLLNNLVQSNANLKLTLTKLESEEEKFRNIFNASPDPIIIVGIEGHILAYNRKAKEQFDFKNKVKDRGLSALLVAGEEEKVYAYISAVGTNNNEMVETQMIIRNQENVSFEMNGFPVDYNGSKASMITLRDVSERKKMEKQILQSIIQTEEKERRRFAQELHDGIGPLLSTTKLYLQWFNKPDAKMDKGILINKLEETLEETIASLREVSNNISPNTLVNFGLHIALQSFIERARNASGLRFSYKNTLSERFKSELEVTIYRILCECINNTLKHAQANQITINVEKINENIMVSYADDGQGFDIKKVMSNANGSGLLNMKTRVQSLGGNMLLDSEKGNGTCISLVFNI